MGLDVADVYVQFPDGSLKRPDISIFCQAPEEMEDAIKQVPTAVIEVISIRIRSERFGNIAADLSRKWCSRNCRA